MVSPNSSQKLVLVSTTSKAAAHLQAGTCQMLQNPHKPAFFHLHLDSIPYFRYPPADVEIATESGTSKPMATVLNNCIRQERWKTLSTWKQFPQHPSESVLTSPKCSSQTPLQLRPQLDIPSKPTQSLCAFVPCNQEVPYDQIDIVRVERMGQGPISLSIVTERTPPQITKHNKISEGSCV